MNDRILKKSTKILLIDSIIIVSILVLGLSQISVTENSNFAKNASRFLDISIQGPTQLFVNQIGVFTANVANPTLVGFETGKFYYNWTARDLNNTILQIAGSTKSVNFRIPSACNGVYLNVVVWGEKSGRGSWQVWVQDPYANPDLFLDALPSVVSYVVQTDGLGWYRAVSGSTGQVITSSTNKTYVEQSVLDALTNGGTVQLMEVQHDYSLAVPSNVLIIQDYQGTRTYIGRNRSDSLYTLPSQSAWFATSFPTVNFTYVDDFETDQGYYLRSCSWVNDSINAHEGGHGDKFTEQLLKQPVTLRKRSSKIIPIKTLIYGCTFGT